MKILARVFKSIRLSGYSCGDSGQRRAEAIAVEQEQKRKWSVIRPHSFRRKTKSPKQWRLHFELATLIPRDKTMHSRRLFLTICIPLVLTAMTQADDIKSQQKLLKTFRGGCEVLRAKESFKVLQMERFSNSISSTQSLSITRSRSLNTSSSESGKLSWAVIRLAGRDTQLGRAQFADTESFCQRLSNDAAIELD